MSSEMCNVGPRYIVDIPCSQISKCRYLYVKYADFTSTVTTKICGEISGLSNVHGNIGHFDGDLNMQCFVRGRLPRTTAVKYTLRGISRGFPIGLMIIGHIKHTFDDKGKGANAIVKENESCV